MQHLFMSLFWCFLPCLSGSSDSPPPTLSMAAITLPYFHPFGCNDHPKRRFPSCWFSKFCPSNLGPRKWGWAPWILNLKSSILTTYSWLNSERLRILLEVSQKKLENTIIQFHQDDLRILVMSDFLHICIFIFIL